MKKIIALLLSVLLLCGCDLTGQPQGTTPDEPDTEAVTDVVTEPVTESMTEPVTEEVTQAPTETTPVPVSITVYHGNENVDGFETVEFLVDEVNGSVLVEKLIEVDVLNDRVCINAMDVEGTELKLDFNAAFGELICSMGTSGEYIRMGSTVNTFLKVFGAETVSITVEGRILESGHQIYDFPMGLFE